MRKASLPIWCRRKPAATSLDVDRGAVGRKNTNAGATNLRGRTGGARMSFSAYDSKPWLARYADYVPEELASPEKSMVDLFEASASRAPEQDAIRYFDAAVSFRELNDLADRFCALLASRGIEKGDRVAVYTQNNPQFLLAQYGAWKRGAVVVPLNPMLKARELDYHLNDSGSKALVCLESLYEGAAREVVPGTSVEHVFTTSELEFLQGKTPPLLESVERRRAEGTDDLLGVLGETEPDAGARAGVSPEDPAYIVYTSGTTGKPKGAVESHSNIAFNAEVYRTWMRLGDDDSVFGV